jgi:hypothetical protein
LIVHHPAQRPAGSDSFAPLLRFLRQPRYAIPGAIVAGMLVMAFFIQPKPTASGIAADDITPEIAIATATPTIPPTQAEPTPTETSEPTAPPSAEGSPEGTLEVAGVLTTPTAEPTPAEVVATAQCGERREHTAVIGVSQTLSNVSVEASRASVYPIGYLRCILLATGGTQAITLAGALGDAEREGSTHVALVDLWITNGSRDFAQLPLDTATFSAAGQTFAALGTLGGGAETIIASGQGRAVTLVGILTNTVGTTSGPVTVSLEGPRLGGEAVAGKYQLFLPTP